MAINEDTDMKKTNHLDEVRGHLDNLDDSELREVRDRINDKLMDSLDTKQASADASADDEKKKYIAQHGSNPIAQTSAQNVPQPVGDEAKDLQNEKAHDEHLARGDREIEQGEDVSRRQHDKLRA